MILQVIILLLTGVVLGYSARIDMEKRVIHAKTLGLVILMGIGYIICNDSNILTIVYVECLLTFFFLIGTLFGMGWGDMFLLWSLGLFIDTRIGFAIFLVAMIASAFLWIIYEVDKYGLWHDREKWQSIKLPLIPSIVIGFYFWIGYALISHFF